MKVNDKLQVDNYIKRFPTEIQEILQKIRAVIRLETPLAIEKISYGMPTFYLKGNLIHFAAFKNHIGIYPSPLAIEAFKTELCDYKTSKGAIQLPLSQPIPYDLIKDITKFRVAENTSKED